MDAAFQRLFSGRHDLATGSRLPGSAPLTPDQQQLWDAIDADDEEGVARLLSTKGADMDLNFPGPELAFPPLHLAVLSGQALSVQALLDAGADVNYRVPTTHETALCIACCHGGAEIMRLLLERGANPHLADWSGQTPLKRLEMLRRSEGGWLADGEECYRLITAACKSSQPLKRENKRGCGGCGRAGQSLLVCSRCHLRWYCSPGCQRGDWPQHKQRCKAVAQVREGLLLVADPGASKEARRVFVKRLEYDDETKAVVVQLKGIKTLLEAVPRDAPMLLPMPMSRTGQPERHILSLCGVNGVMFDRDVRLPMEPFHMAAKLRQEGVRQFVGAGGYEVVLRRVLQPDCPAEDRVQSMRMLGCMSTLVNENVGPRTLAAKGDVVAVLQLVQQILEAYPHDNVAICHACIIVGGLAMLEGPPLEQATEEAERSEGEEAGAAAEGSAAGAAGGGELGPITQAIFKHIDLRAAARLFFTQAQGVLQAPQEMFVALSREKAAFDQLMGDSLVAQQLMAGSFSSLFMNGALTNGLAVEWWALAENHQPGLLHKHWAFLQSATARCMEVDVASVPPFLLAVLDMVAPPAPDAAQQALFRSTRHRLKAARMLCALGQDPPRQVKQSFTEYVDTVLEKVEACEPEVAELIREAATRYVSSLLKAERRRAGKKAKGGRRR